MKKIFLILNLLIIGGIFVGNYFYLTDSSLLIKAFCSGGFVLIGILNLLYAFLRKKINLKFQFIMTIGLVLAMLGDVVLGYQFIIGAGLFAAGHICYLIAYGFIVRVHWVDFLFSGIIFAGAAVFLLFYPLIVFSDPVMKWVCIVYAFIISAMVGKAVSNLVRKPGILTGILTLGSILFFFSDLMLAFDWFIGVLENAGTLCMATYYPAQCLLAFSTYYIMDGGNK